MGGSVRTNCWIWGSSLVIIVIVEAPQPSEATGSPRPQVIWVSVPARGGHSVDRPG